MLTYLKSKLRSLCQLASLGIIVIAQAQKEVEDSTIYNKPFYDACAQGTLEQVQEFLSKDQSKFFRFKLNFCALVWESFLSVTCHLFSSP